MAIWHKKADVMNGIRESFLSLDWFSLTFKTYSYGPLKGLNRPHRPMDPSLTGFQSEPVVYMLTTSGCQVDFSSSTLCGSLRKTSFHTRTTCPSMHKSQVQSRFVSGTSLWRRLFPRMKLSACTSHSSICFDGDCSSSASTSVSETNRKVSK